MSKWKITVVFIIFSHFSLIYRNNRFYIHMGKSLFLGFMNCLVMLDRYLWIIKLLKACPLYWMSTSLGLHLQEAQRCLFIIQGCYLFDFPRCLVSNIAFSCTSYQVSTIFSFQTFWHTLSHSHLIFYMTYTI